MRLSTALGVLLALGSSAHAATTVGATATIFAPGSFAGDAEDNGDDHIRQVSLAPRLDARHAQH